MVGGDTVQPVQGMVVHHRHAPSFIPFSGEESAGRSFQSRSIALSADIRYTFSRGSQGRGDSVLAADTQS